MAEVEVEEHYKRQEARMVALKTDIRKQMEDDAIRDKIQGAVSGIVREIVSREIAQRVRKEVWSSTVIEFWSYINPFPLLNSTI